MTSFEIEIDFSNSFVLLQAAIKLANTYGLKISVKVLPTRSSTSSTTFEQHTRFILKEAHLFAELYGFASPAAASTSHHLFLCQESCLNFSANVEIWCNAVNSATRNMLLCHDAQEVFEVMKPIWQAKDISALSSDVKELATKEIQSLQQNSKELEQLRYYGSGSLEFVGEWYSPQRLHHLERRLKLQGFGASKCPLLFDKELDLSYQQSLEPNEALSGFRRHTESLSRYRELSITGASSTIELFYSFRSPYSQLALPRLRALCAMTGKRLHVRLLMPMVVRGLPVPRPKAVFIGLDCKREADLWGLDFGWMRDPCERICFTCA